MTDQGGHRYAAADAELAGFFTSAIGLKGQSYDANGGGAFNSNSLHDARIRALDAGSVPWFDRVEATFMRLPANSQRVLALVYTPHGWPTWLADALSTPWGGGSFVALAAGLPRAVAAAGGGSPLVWLASRGRGGANERESKAMTDLYRRLRQDCEDLRLGALALYDVVRVERIKRSQAAEREEKAAISTRNIALFDDLTGAKSDRDSQRFLARMKRTA